MTKPRQTRLLVVDDHLVVKMGPVALLNRRKDFEAVAEGGDGQGER